MPTLDVALLPTEIRPAVTCVVIDCIRTTTVVAHALAAGYRDIVCVTDVERALALAAEREDSVAGGERGGLPPEGFALGNSPSEYRVARAERLVLTTTNGTRAIVRSSACTETVLCASLVNLDAVAAEVARAPADVVICCAGAEGAVTLDDVYVAGRLAERLRELDASFRLTDAALVASATARHYSSAREAISASSSARRLRAVGLGADVDACARESTLDVVPRVASVADDRAELVPHRETTMCPPAGRTETGAGRC